jgi:predicted chitinase
MDTLGYGASGAGVRALQGKLNSLGFDVGTVDGEFGPRTQGALIGFQRSRALREDGIAGPKTLNALGLAARPAQAAVIDTVTTAQVSKLFPAISKPGIETYLPYLLSALRADGLVSKPMVSMALATIRAESEAFRPISEGISKYNTSPGGHPFDRYDDRSDLGNRGRPDGADFRGRGFIQLTGRHNYEKYSEQLFQDNRLVNEPELANDPEIASKLLSRFLKDKEGKIEDALAVGDLKRARRLVNGGSHGLARFSEAYGFGMEVL